MPGSVRRRPRPRSTVPAHLVAVLVLACGLAPGLAPGPAGAAAPEPTGPARTDGAAASATDGLPAPTPLERRYSERAGMPLRLVGHRPFRDAGGPRPATETVPAPVGLVDDSYRLGPGDRVTVTYYGARTATRTVAVHSDGMLVLPDGPPVPAAGHSLGSLRASVARAVEDAFMATDVRVSLAAARQRTITVIGEVQWPGRHRLGAFSTVIDALFAAGGPTALGSLRAVRLVRAGTVRTLDLADLAGDGTSDGADLPLADGDRLVVPPLGPTVAIAGAVGRPGIHELPAGGGAMTAAALLARSGGPLPGATRVLRFGWGRDGGAEAEVLAPPFDRVLADGDLVVVRLPADGTSRATVTVEGAVAAPGRYPAVEARTVGAAVAAAGGLDAAAYRPFAAVLADPRRAGADAAPRALALPPAGSVAADRDPALAPGDRLVVLSRRDVAFLSSASVRRALTGEVEPAAGPVAPDQPAGCSALAALADTGRGGGLAAAARLAGLAPPGAGPGGDATATAPCPAVFADRPALLGLALEHAVLVVGGAASPGLYPVAEPLPVAALLAAAGVPGPHRAAARLLSGHGGEPAGPGDVIDAGAPLVHVEGPVRAPGSQPLASVPTVGALLAGGARLTADAYPLAGVIRRRDPGTGAESHRLFAPTGAADGGSVALAPGDRVSLFDRAWIRARAARPAGAAGLDAAAARRPEPESRASGPDPAGAAGLPRIVAADTRDPGAGDARGRTDTPGAGSAAGTAAATAATASRPDAGPLRPDPPPALEAALAAAAVRIEGAVAHPGAYPVAEPTALDRLIDAAGGFAGDADRSAAEIAYSETVPGGGSRLRRTTVDLGVTPPDLLRLAPGDAVRIPVRPDAGPPATATIAGAVRRPGTYSLLPGERLSDLVERAGGLGRDAFTPGAVLTRRDAAARQRQALEAAAATIEAALAERLAGDDPPDAALIDRARSLAARLRAAEATGRVVVEADPAVLRAEPALDPVLVDGDVIRYPVRPLSVSVTGAVLSPAALQYRPGKSVADYLAEAGGLARDADAGRIFVLHPDGRAEPVGGSVWRHTPVLLGAGSTVVVPRDTRELGTLGVLEAIGRVIGQVAIGTSVILSLAVDD